MAVDERAVRRAEVLDHHAAVDLRDLRVLARELGILIEHPEPGLTAADHERLASDRHERAGGGAAHESQQETCSGGVRLLIGGGLGLRVGGGFLGRTCPAGERHVASRLSLARGGLGRGELDLHLAPADLHRAALRERRRRLDPPAVHERPVARTQVLDLDPSGDRPDRRVAAGDLWVFDRQVGALSPDGQLPLYFERAPGEWA
jgi:hypothetical protein